MNDDLVKRLRGLPLQEQGALCEEAADRIEELEKALRQIAAGYETEWSISTFKNMMDVAKILSNRINIARAALEGKKDD